MKRGSALLIVLGMLSFMVVSAVGFSVYMRSSRAPSSYLRRNIAARYLVRAALSKAMEDLEGEWNDDSTWGGNNTARKFYGIYDDPFPGVVMDDSTARSSSDGSQNGDYWLGRVFMPFGAVKEDDLDKTVSTLTLEALAYLPPAIVDDVRRLSRYTRTACWRQLPNDAGRYAYCAVNVSDLFDINRLRADFPRDSGINRVTLGSLCCNDFNDIASLDQSAAKSLDLILDKALDTGKVNGNGVPFTSLADFNLVAGGAGGSGDWAPFMNFVGGSGTFLDGGSTRQANAMFITDTWFPPEQAAADVVSLDLAEAQPFVNNKWNATSFRNIIDGGCLNTASTKSSPTTGINPGYQYLYNLGMYGLACLYDYLDSDSVPVSLALPTTEAVPMVVGVGSPKQLQPTVADATDNIEIKNIKGTVVKIGDTENTPVPTSDITIKRTCKLVTVASLFGAQPVSSFAVAYPFKRMATENRTGSFKARALMRVWFSSGGEPGSRISGSDVFERADVPAWDNLNSVSVANGVATCVSGEVDVGFSSDVTDTDGAVKSSGLRFEFPNIENLPLYYEVTETPEAPAGYTSPIPDEGTYNPSYKAYGDGLRTDANRFLPLKYDSGKFVVDSEWEDAAKASAFDKTKAYADGTEFNLDGLSGKFRIHAAIWVQVRSGGRVVDMVPAAAEEDVQWLGAGSDIGEGVGEALGGGMPLLYFRSGSDIAYKDIKTTLPNTTSFDGWNSLYAVDPRFNFAPEDWYADTGNEAQDTVWKGNVTPLLGTDGRDHDIFMFVSDQEYLQSIGELQFLPWLEDLEYDSSKAGSPKRYSPAFNGASFSQRIGFDVNKLENKNFFWKTYSAYPAGGVDLPSARNPYEMTGDGGRPLDILPSGGFKLNPFSKDDRVIGAAVVGTPFDWYVASTNDNQTQSGGRKNQVIGGLDLSSMMSTYSFGKSSLAKMSNDNIADICGAIKDAFDASAAGGKKDWLSAWDSLMWQQSGKANDDNKTFMATDISMEDNLHGVDRKYLYSYWRECFANRQQLFLIFVRAEPTAVGGGAKSRASSQLGGRAVALVWRDPAPPPLSDAAGRPKRTALTTKETVLENRGKIPPHRTRVLFYHQFE